jgi:hypothetical protein
MNYQFENRSPLFSVQEHEQLVAAVDIHRVSQLAALGISRLASEQPLQLPFKRAAMRGNGGFAPDFKVLLKDACAVGRRRPDLAEARPLAEPFFHFGPHDGAAVTRSGGQGRPQLGAARRACP